MHALLHRPAPPFAEPDQLGLLYTTVLVGLDDIQERLETPVDGIGVADIRFRDDELTSVREVALRSLAKPF